MKTGTQWCWANSADDEQWQGPHDSRDDAISEAAKESGREIGDSFCVARCVYPDPADHVDFTDIIERADESAVDNEFYSGGDLVFKVADPEKAKEELAAWARKHLKAQAFTVEMRTVEVVALYEEMTK